MDLNEARKRLPELAGLSDESALNVIHQVYYPTMEKAALAERLGYKAPPPPAPERSMARAAGDLGLQFGGGVVSGVRMMSDLFGADNAVSGGLRGAEDALRQLQSAAAKADQQRIAEIMKEAESKGFADQVVAGVRAFGQAPAAMIAQALGTSIPTLATAMIPGGAAARLAGAAGVGAAQGAGNIKGVIYEEVKNNPLPGETPEQTEFRAARAQEYGGQNAGQIALGGGLGALAGSTGMERTLAGLRNGVTQAAPGMAARVGMGAAAEAVPEIAQGGQEKLASNLALRNEGFDVDPMAGVVAGATMEGLAGGVMGGAFGVPNPSVQNREPLPQPQPAPPVEPAGPMTRALNTIGPRITNTLTSDLLGRNTDPLAGQIAADRLAAEDSAVARNQFADRNGAMLAGGGLEGSRADPLANMLADARTAEANSFTNVQQAANRRPPMPASDAVRILDEAKARGMDMTAAPHPDGGFVVVPRQWVTPDMAAQAETEIADTLARMQQADAAPVQRAERRKTEPVDLSLNTDPVAGYIEDLRKTNTPAARAYVGEFDAGRVTRADVEQRMQADRGLTADERLARAAAEGLKLNPKGDPFKTLMAANLAAKTTPGTVIEVPGGYAIRPQERTLANTAAQEVPEADAAPVQADPPAEAVSFADAADEAGTPAVSGSDEPGAVQALSGYEQAKAVRDAADARVKAASNAMQKYPRGAMGLTPDDVKATPQWKADKAEMDAAMRDLQNANGVISKKFAKESKAEREARRAANVQDAPQGTDGTLTNEGTIPEAAAVEAPAPARGDGAAAAGVPDAGTGAGVRADGVDDLGPDTFAGSIKREMEARAAADERKSRARKPSAPAKEQPEAVDSEVYRATSDGAGKFTLESDESTIAGNGDATPRKFASESDALSWAKKNGFKTAAPGATDVQADGVNLSKNPQELNTSAEPAQKTAESEQVKASEQAADTFELGGDAMANLTGQKDIFGAAESEAETPRLTPAEAAELMEWQSLGTKDGVTKHILTFYESKAKKDANRGRMTIATITKGDRSATAWMVDGDDKTFGPLALAKKRGMEIGMAKAKTDGFVQMSALEQALGADVMSRPVDKAAKLRRDADKLAAEARKMLEGIEPGQPIMSTRDRNLRERSMEKMRKAAELNTQADALDAAKPAAPAQQEAGSTKKIPPFPVDGYRLERYYANGAKVRPLPAKTFSPADVIAISEWFKSIGWSVTSGSGANGVNATNDVGMTVDDLPEPYTAAQRKKDEAQKAADERAADKQKAQDDYLASTDAGKFVSDMFGDAMNRFNLTALAKVLAGDEKTFGGLFSNRAADVLTDAGIVTEGRSVKDVVADIKAKFDAAQQEAQQAGEFNAQAAWDAMTPAARGAMLDKWAGAGQTDMGERYKSRAWVSFNAGEKDTLAAVLKAAQEPATDDRDTFTLKRLNRETNKMEPVTFKRGEYVEVTLIGSDKKDYGEIDGISQARREFSVNGLWHTMGAAYKAERPAAPVPKDMAPLSSVIDKMNAKNGEGLTDADRVPEQKPASKTPTVDRHEALMKSVREGKATAEQFKAAFESLVANKDAVIAELETKTKAELLKAGGYQYFHTRYANEKKADVARALYREMLDEYSLGDGYSYGMGKNAKEEAVRRIVEATDDAKLEQYAKDRQAAIAEAQAERAAKAAAMENPQTLADFKAIIAKHIGEGKSAKDAFLALTPEQRIQFDTLAAESTREAREARKRERKTEVRAAGQTTGGEIIAAKHTRDGYDLFVVKLADRLSKEDYSTVLASAKKLGGWYSAFRGNGAIPGFQFKDKANAEAFLKLAGGDTTDAQAQAEQRRDAFEDDRSETAVERLRTMADKLTEQAAEIENAERKTNTARRARFAASALNGAAEIENAERKTNTARRARFAASALNGAAEMKAKASTMRNIAQAIEAGGAKFLDAVRTKSQVDLLTGIVATAKNNELRAKYPSYADQEKRKGEPATAETADFAEFPAFTAYRSDLASLGRQMLEVEGTKKLGQRLMSVADDVSDAYLEFAKEPGNLFNLSRFSFKRGEKAETAIFASRALAETAIKRSGLTGKAIVLAEKRGVNRIILSPSEAINAGIWTGDGDKRITLSADFGAELVEAIGRRGNKSNKLTVPWQFQNAYDRRKALSRMGIETASEYRSALREFIGLQERAIANKVREMELQMVGRKADGLDFFPTPAEVADQMVEAADLTPDMDVLEPSAGMGHIADRINDAGVSPDVVEMSEDRRELLTEKGYELVGRDFLDLSGKLYDRIVMNPPFSNRRDAEHVMHAYTLLKPGGRIVAIMGEGVFFGQDKKAQEFRDWLESVGGTSEKLPPGSFMDPSLPVNTGVSARMVVIDKPAGDVKFSIDDGTGPADTADYGPATQAHRDAAARLAESFADRIEGGGSHTDLLDAVAPGDGKRGQAAAAVANIARRLFRRQVVFVKFKGAPLFNGVVSKSVPGVIFLNIDSQKPLLSVLGHELLHEMAKSHPTMYANLSRRLDDLIKNETEYAVRTYNAYKKAGISTKGLDTREELEADIVGDNFMDAGFWQAMGENQPGLFRRIVNFVTKWLDNLSQKIADYRPFGTDEFLTDIAAARDAVASAMREFSGAEAGAVADPVDGDVKLSAAEKQDQTETAAFKKWFGDSKVVDANGKPLRVFHGTTADFSAFDGGKLGSSTGHPTAKAGFFFSASSSVAELFSGEKWSGWPLTRGFADGANVMPVYLSVSNPVTITAREFVRMQRGSGESFAEMVSKASAEGHDGVRIVGDKQLAESIGGDEYAADAWIAFRPEQIKSAIGNRGTFDPENPDIRFSRVDDIKRAIPAFDVKTAPKNSWAHYRGMAMQALGRRQIVDLYAEELPQLEQYDYLVQQMDAEKNDSGAEADKLAQDWGKLKDEKQLAELMHDATLAQIDPAKPMETGVLQAQYRELKARFDALTPEAQALYRQARDMYDGHYRKVQKAIKERIERSEMSAGQKRQIMAKMDEELFKKLKGVYFPLARFGQYVIVVKDANGEVKNVTRAESINEAEEARKELHKAFPKHMGYTVGKVLKQAEFNAGRDAVGKGFMADLMDALDAKGIDDELRDTVAQLYLSSLPDLSWAKHGIHRKGTPGFSQDARRAFAQNMFHGARYLAKLRYADQLQDELIAMQEHVKSYEGVDEYDSIQAQQVVDEMVKRHEIMMNPKASPVSTALTSFGFVFHLGLSPASAMVNMSQTALVAYPMMGAKWGWGKASAALLAASQDVVKAKNDLGTILKGAELDAYERAVKDGTIDVTMAHDLAGISQGEDQKVFWKIRPVMRAASFMFHHAERFNRQATFIAAWRMAKEAGPDKTADQLYEEAKKLTYDSHFDYAASNRPRVMQGNWQRVIFLFKQYAQAMVYTLSRNAYLSVKGASPADRKMARKTLGGILAAHAAAAGVLGLPIVGPLLTAASFLGSDDDEPWDAEVAMQNLMADMVGPKAAEVMARGFSRLTPFDLSGRVAINKLILPDVQEGLEGKQWAESFATASLGPVAGIGVNWARGFQKITEGHYAMGIEDMMPTALRGPLRAMRYASEGAVDKSGVVIVDEVGPGGIAGQALGFSPSEVRRATERKAAIMDYDRSLADRRSALVRQWAEAQMNGDTDGVKDVMAEIQGFNKKNPDRKITMPNLIQSVRARRRRIEQAEDGIYLPKSREGAREAVRF